MLWYSCIGSCNLPRSTVTVTIAIHAKSANTFWVWITFIRVCVNAFLVAAPATEHWQKSLELVRAGCYWSFNGQTKITGIIMSFLLDLNIMFMLYPYHNIKLRNWDRELGICVVFSDTLLAQCLYPPRFINRRWQNLILGVTGSYLASYSGWSWCPSCIYCYRHRDRYL